MTKFTPIIGPIYLLYKEALAPSIKPQFTDLIQNSCGSFSQFTDLRQNSRSSLSLSLLAIVLIGYWPLLLYTYTVILEVVTVDTCLSLSKLVALFSSLQVYQVSQIFPGFPSSLSSLQDLLKHFSTSRRQDQELTTLGEALSFR